MCVCISTPAPCLHGFQDGGSATGPTVSSGKRAVSGKATVSGQHFVAPGNGKR